MFKVIALLIFTSAFGIYPAQAALVTTSPALVCSMLKDIGLATSGWKNHYDNEFGCSSAYKHIGAGSPMPNNLAYYPEGNRNAATQVRLVLNVNDKSRSTSGHTALLGAAEILSEKIVGVKLPQTIKSAIKKGRPNSGRFLLK